MAIYDIVPDNDDDEPTLWGIPIVPMSEGDQLEIELHLQGPDGKFIKLTDEERQRALHRFFSPREEIPFHVNCRCLVLPEPGIADAVTRALLATAWEIPYEWVDEYVRVTLDRLAGGPDGTD